MAQVVTGKPAVPVVALIAPPIETPASRRLHARVYRDLCPTPGPLRDFRIPNRLRAGAESEKPFDSLK
jgi:hypothetical protein